MQRWGPLAGGFENVVVKEHDADGGVAMMKVSKKMDMSLVLKPERWAPREVFQKQNFSTVCFQKKTGTWVNNNSLDLFFLFLQFWKLEKNTNTTQLNKEQGKTDILTKHHFCWSSSCLWF